jgi:predicted nucleic acid-binding Zn ribbon protein
MVRIATGTEIELKLKRLQQLADRKNVMFRDDWRYCIFCGKKIGDDDKDGVCSVCFGKTEDLKYNPDQPLVPCPLCGTNVSEGDYFCGSCGG